MLKNDKKRYLERSVKKKEGYKELVVLLANLFEAFRDNNDDNVKEYEFENKRF